MTYYNGIIHSNIITVIKLASLCRISENDVRRMSLKAGDGELAHSNGTITITLRLFSAALVDLVVKGISLPICSAMRNN